MPTLTDIDKEADSDGEAGPSLSLPLSSSNDLSQWLTTLVSPPYDTGPNSDNLISPSPNPDLNHDLNPNPGHGDTISMTNLDCEIAAIEKATLDREIADIESATYQCSDLEQKRLKEEEDDLERAILMSLENVEGERAEQKEKMIDGVKVADVERVVGLSNIGEVTVKEIDVDKEEKEDEGSWSDVDGSKKENEDEEEEDEDEGDETWSDLDSTPGLDEISESSASSCRDGNRKIDDSSSSSLYSYETGEEGSEDDEESSTGRWLLWLGRCEIELTA
jgi:hypothetical protein